MSNSRTKIPKEKQMQLFTHEGPLPHKIRPALVSEIVGQKHLISDNGVLTKWIENDLPYSVILWGAPGTGKTTIATVAKLNTNKEFIYLSGAATNISELREVIKEAEKRPGQLILFIDEIHRLAKNQQDVLLEPLEVGNFILIGSTTENPHVSITRALHSRVKVLELKPLEKIDMEKLIERAINHPQGCPDCMIDSDAKALLISSSSGDARRLLYNLEEAYLKAKKINNLKINKSIVQNILQSSQNQIGADPDSYYHLVSALQKSLRGSDPDAALYWLARLLAGGADPVHVARRIWVTATEDIGLADSNALTVATNAYFFAQSLGMPEARIALSQAVLYLACAPKSNTTVVSIDKAISDVNEKPPYPVPIHLRSLGGEGYKYPHSFKDVKVEQDYLPKELVGGKYFNPNERDNI